jgi:hypothetical protein
VMPGEHDDGAEAGVDESAELEGGIRSSIRRHAPGGLPRDGLRDHGRW